MGRYVANGKQVLDPEGAHFADAAHPLAALLIVAALEVRNHRPAMDADRVFCSRCQSVLPDEAHEPCVPKTPRCPDTVDMFAEPLPVAAPKRKRKAA